jgi:AraC-like DNA-binding protein
LKNHQLILDLCTLNNINYICVDLDDNSILTTLPTLKNALTKRYKLIILKTRDYNYIVVKKEKLYFFGPFEKDNILVYDNSKLLYFMICENTFSKKEIPTIFQDISLNSLFISNSPNKINNTEINIIDFLEESVKTGDIEAIKLYIKIMFISLFAKESKIDSFRLQKNLIIYIFSYIFSTIDDNNIDPDFNIFLTSIITSEFEFCENSSQLLLKAYQLIDKISDSFNFTIKKSNQKIREARFYIDNNLEKKLTLEKVAREMGISAKYLSTLFFEVTNTTFKEYVNRQRIDKARNLLAYSNKSISEISRQVGIKSPNNFISFFKRYTSKTPNTFREQIKL